MLIHYKCDKCGADYYHAKILEGEQKCTSCGGILELVHGNIDMEVNTFHEERFIADEAVYDTSMANRNGKLAHHIH